MSRSATGYVVRPKDMKALLRALGLRGDQGAVYDAARTLIGRAEPQQTQLSPVSVASLALPLDGPVNVPADPDAEPQPYDMPSPEADALDRIADLWGYAEPYANKLRSIAAILRETGRAL